jgi:thioredoxin-like negative regulator of GroEL
VARKPDRKPGSVRYLFGFIFTALVLVGMTLFLVLVVLPRRYVLNAGLRESGVSFPSEAAPFLPPEELPRAAPPPLPRPVEVVRGPAEIFWAKVEPLLRGNLHSVALPHFTRYLESYPGDQGVRKEFAITLARAGRPAEAVQVFDQLLAQEDDPGIRLLMARELRDLQRLEEASAEYALLSTQDPGNETLALEWGRALAWGRDYVGAAEVLGSALSRNSESAELRIVLAEVFYWSGRLDEADELLAGMDQDVLERAGGNSLRADVIAALTPPEPEVEEAPVSTPTALDLAIEAFVKEEYEQAATFYLEALRAAPEDTSTWRAYADLLQYALEDLEGAREALHRVEASGGDDPVLRFRLAQLDLWTGRNSEASHRLHAMLTDLEEETLAATPSDSVAFGHEDVAEIRALLGDLHRWEGERTLSGEAYSLALAVDSANLRAGAGLDELQGEIGREIEEQELPGWGGDLYSLGDSDDFARVEVGVEGVGMDGSWVWGVRSGNRWLEGLDLSGSLATQRGLFLELESARWWDWGTIRTGLHFGLEEIRPDGLDYSFGSSLRFADLGGFRADFRYDHGLAYPLTVTLQSVFAEVVQDRVQGSLVRQLTDRWGISMAADATRFSAHAPEFEEAEPSYRFEMGINLGRSLSDALVLGTNLRALTYSAPAPAVGGARLFWDPQALISTGLYARFDRDVKENWRVRAVVNPSMAFIDERTSPGFESVPHFSAEAGISHLGERFRTTLDAFFYQGRFDGYRAYGLRFSVSAKDWFRGGGDR